MLYKWRNPDGAPEHNTCYKYAHTQENISYMSLTISGRRYSICNEISPLQLLHVHSHVDYTIILEHTFV